MRVLLVNSNMFRFPWPVIPIGLCRIAAAVKQAGHEVKVIDLCFSTDPVKEIECGIKGFCPDLVGIGIRNIDNSSGYNTQFLLDRIKKQVITPCKEAFPGPIVLGGAAVGISGLEMLRFFDLELAIRGDGETAIVELIKRLEVGLSLSNLGGLIRIEAGEVTVNNPALLVKDADALPAPDLRRYLDLSQYKRFGTPLPVQTKRGCALKCTYCTYNKIEGRQYRLRNPLLVALEIESLIDRTGIDLIEFVDSTFNIPLDHAKAVLRAIVDRGIVAKFRTMGLNPGAVDEELVDLMKRVGFRDLDLGAESGCDVTLKGLGKNYTKADILKTGKLLRERNIPAMWFLLIGAPGETKETIRETFDTISEAASKWDMVIVGIGIRAYNGTPIAEQMGRESPECSTDNFFHPVAYIPQEVSLKEMFVLTKSAVLQFPNFATYSSFAFPKKATELLVPLVHKIVPEQPPWRAIILVKRLLTYMGVQWAFQLVWRIMNWSILSDGKSVWMRREREGFVSAAAAMCASSLKVKK
jgi:radical SAM superfamily enzyme YgiQ (UPF0313 family)